MSGRIEEKYSNFKLPQVKRPYKNTQSKRITTEDNHYRAMVVSNVDEEMEGRIKVYIPKLSRNLKRGNLEKEKILDPGSNPNKFHKASRIKNPKPIITHDYYWARPSTLIGSLSQQIIPVKNQYIYVYFENGDPQKLYYDIKSPALVGEKQRLSKLVKSLEYGNTGNYITRPNIVSLMELPNSNIIGFDYNGNLNSFEITFASGHFIHIVSNKNESYIELHTEKGNFIKMDDITGDITFESIRDVIGEVGRDLDLSVTRDVKLRFGRNLEVSGLGNADILIGGTLKAVVGGAADVDIGGNLSSIVGGNHNSVVNGSFDGSISGSSTSVVGGNATINVNGRLNATANGAKVRSSGSIELDASTSISLNAPNINIDSTRLSIDSPTVSIRTNSLDII